MTNDSPGKSNPVAPEAPYYVKGLALGVPAYLFGAHLWTWILYLPVFLAGGADFCRLYTAGYMVRTGHAKLLYDTAAEAQYLNQLVGMASLPLPFNHPSYEVLLYAPFSLFRFRTAYFAFLAFNLAILAIVFRMLRPRLNNLAGIVPWLPAAMFLSFLPIAATLLEGQDSIVFLTLLTAAAISLDRDREMTAGALVGIGLFRSQLVLPIAFLFFVWRRWRFTAGFALTSAVAGAISLSLVGFAQARIYARSIASVSLFSTGDDLFKNGINPVRMANLRGLIVGVAGTRFPAFWIQAVTVILSAAALLWVASRAPAKKGMDALLVAIAASAVVSYHLFIYDMSVLLIPVAVILSRFIGAEATGDSGGRLAARAAALMFVAPICESFAPYHFYLVSLPLCAFLVVLMQRIRYDSAVRSLTDQLGS
jgi:hypothetical protein